MLSQIIEQSENSTVDQNSGVLSTVADYSAELAMFVGDSNVIINDTVSYIGLKRIIQWECHFVLQFLHRLLMT